MSEKMLEKSANKYRNSGKTKDLVRYLVQVGVRVDIIYEIKSKLGNTIKEKSD